MVGCWQVRRLLEALTQTPLHPTLSLTEPKEADLQLTGSSIIQLSDLETAGGMLAPDADADTDANANNANADELPPPPVAPTLARSKSSMERHLGTVLGPLAAAYHWVYTNQPGGRDFIGMRDYYCTLKMLRGRIAAACKAGALTAMSREDLYWALCRNFGGRADLLEVGRKGWGYLRRWV